MTLKKRLAIGIIIVLAAISVFFSFTLISLRAIDHFTSDVLNFEIEIARTYERIADLWMQISEQKHANLLKPHRQESLVSSELKQNFEQMLSNLEVALYQSSDGDLNKNFNELKSLAVGYLKQLEQFERLVSRRRSIWRKEVQSRADAGKSISSEINDLLSRFAAMMEDFSSTFRASEFKSQLDNASSLIGKISRIEKDMLMAQTEIALYLSFGKNGAPLRDHDMSRDTTAERVEKRLQAVIALLEYSAKEAANPLSKRVLQNIRQKIIEFKRSFAQVRDILEHPDSEQIEIDDSILDFSKKLKELRQKGAGLAINEAEYFWNRIFATANALLKKSRTDFNLSLAFLAVCLCFGLYILLVIPGKLGGPLLYLSQQVRSFRLGSQIFSPEFSGTIEVDSLSRSFTEMAQRLNMQAEVNRKYLETIHNMTAVYLELQRTNDGFSSTGATRLEKAVNMILKQLIETVPEVDLVKVMLIRENSGNKCFARFGDLHFSTRFIESAEYRTYCESIPSCNSAVPGSEDEVIPWEEGLTGWYFENNLGIKTTDGGGGFYAPTYPLVTIEKNPVLLQRNYEKGLSGCLLLEPLVKPTVNSEVDRIDQPEYLGALFVYFLDKKAMLSWQEIFFIQIMSSQIASVIETDLLLEESNKKRKLEYHISMAKDIQDNLLPHSVPEIAGLQITKIGKPAAEVGGDYYDFFMLSDNRTAVVVADAAGKNVSAAIIMTVFKTTLSTMDLSSLSAAEVLTKANLIIEKNITNDRFITALYVIIDSVTGRVELACAGHNSALVVSGKGRDLSISEKSAQGLPLGIADHGYESAEFFLQPGDLLLLYTDGVTEARNPEGEEFGFSRLKKFFSRSKSSRSAGALLKEIENFMGSAGQHDDITAVTIEFTGKHNGRKN